MLITNRSLRGQHILMFVFAFSLAVSMTYAADIQLHVAPNGNDQGSGDVNSPFSTPHRAVQALKDIAHQSDATDVRVVFHEGVYRIDKPLIIGPQHVPAGGSLTFVAKDGDRVVISGGKQVAGWAVGDDGTWSTTLPDVARGAWSFRELFVAGQRRPRARHPNEGFLQIKEAFPDKRSGFTFHTGDLPADWTDGGELVFLHDWSTSRVPVVSIEQDLLRLTTAFSIGDRGDHFQIDHFEPHPRYFVENAPAFLDAPGEWFLDQHDGKLTYRPLPGEHPDETEIVAPLATALVVVQGESQSPVRNVHFHGLSFEHCAWPLPSGGYAAGQATAHQRRDNSTQRFSRRLIPAAVRFELAEDCSFTHGRIAHLGTSGIEFGSRTRRCRLEDSVIEDISGNGVNLGEDASRMGAGRPWWRSAPEQAASEHVVAFNRIEHCGQQFFGAVAVWAGLVHDVQITNNEIAHHPYTGVSLGWMWNPTPTPVGNNLVAENHIHHVMQVLSDGGGIYTLGRQPGTRLVRNVIHDVPPNAGRAESNGMFLDEGSDQIEIDGNVIYNVARSPLRFHQAKEMTVRGNTLVVPDADTPPLRYNNTNSQTVEQIDNHVIPKSAFDPSTVPSLNIGPRKMP